MRRGKNPNYWRYQNPQFLGHGASHTLIKVLGQNPYLVDAVDEGSDGHPTGSLHGLAIVVRAPAGREDVHSGGAEKVASVREKESERKTETMEEKRQSMKETLLKELDYVINTKLFSEMLPNIVDKEKFVNYVENWD